MRLLFTALLFSGLCFGQVTAGQSLQTMDSGAVTYSSTPVYLGDASCPSGTRYTNQVQTIMPSQPQPCWTLEQKTSDGVGTNTNEWLMQATQGGGTQPSGTSSTVLWGNSFQYANNTQPRADWAWVEGNKPGFAKHLNVAFLAGTRGLVGVTGGIADSSTCSFTMAVAGGQNYNPQPADVSGMTPYTIYFGVQGEKISITGLSGGPSSYTVTACARGTGGTTAASHTGAERFWALDTNGVVAAYPREFCDYAEAHSFVAQNAGNGTVPGHANPVIFDIGVSDGAQGALMMALMGKNLLSYAGCKSQYANTNWTKGGAFLISPKPDLRLVMMLTQFGPNFPSPRNVTADGSEPGSGLSNIGPTAGVGDPSVASVVNYSQAPSINGLGVTGPNATYTQGGLWSPINCQPGNYSGCPIAPDSDACSVPIYVVTGQADTNVGSWQIWNWVQTATCLQIHFLQFAPPLGHQAGFNTDDGATNADCGGSAFVVLSNGNAVACWDGQVMQWLNTMLTAPYNAKAPRGAMLTN